MALLQDLVKQVSDPKLRQRILQEVDKLAKQKKFGLVFEEHLPECTPLYDVSIKKGHKVALKNGAVNDIYIVMDIKRNTAICEHRLNHEKKEIALDDLVSVAEFGEPIYPYLKPMDSVCNAPDSDLWHTLIEADNYHALQLLDYLYHGKVDCIYIDPPYNTGAKDWKYNNDYVDSNDQYRHSKWLSFMEKRLKLAKKLLNPEDSVLIVTIDEKEFLHLGCLLEDIFPDARIQMVSTMINPANVARIGEFGRSGEYIFFVMLGKASPQRVKLNREWVSSKGRTHTGKVRWDLLKRSGTNSERKHSPKGFYPIYINNITGKVECVGEPLPNNISKALPRKGCTALLPIRKNGTEGNWQWSTETFKSRLKQGRIRIGGNYEKGFTVYILKNGEYSKIVNGEFVVADRGINGELICEENSSDQVMAVPGDIWKISLHDSTQYGSRFISNIFPDKIFTFPKSVYAVKDCLHFFTVNKKNALIIDFFAGSGTTLNAVNLLNVEDGGHRRCIMVTNNEVSDEEATSLKRRGYRPGDKEWEKLGIAHHVTWPRTTCSIKGIDVNEAPLNGEYLTDLTEEKHTKRQIKQLNLVIPDGSAGTKIKKQIISLLGKNKLAQSLVKNESSYVISEDYPVAILFDDEKLNDFLDDLENQIQIRELYICTQNNKVFKKAKEAIGEILGDFIETVPVTIPMMDGFKANAAFFKLGFLDKNAVALGQQFKELLPVLWMKAGCIGLCPQLDTKELPSLLMLPKNHFAVLLDEMYYLEFDAQLMKYPEIKTVYIITDSELAYRNMIQGYECKECYQLYRDYLDNFRINTGR
ncbi:MAG: DNA methyltransferase [Anaerobutyricum hallii]|uniref:site-specific DNA-methyltransferase n=1 Tax=Anaerobutyricum hallii TaxID=39488 RepID=UPI0024329974|nr:DNA methyltransferase [Anaerobutyricum hallii]MDD6587437.1 DNA methyltransferase [Anaerobutyricum hallii]